MNRGYRVVYHKTIPETDIHTVVEYINTKIIPWFSSENSYKSRRDSGAYFRRGNFGLILDEKDNKYVFRRLSKNRRIFGVLPITLLEGKHSKIEIKQCMCGLHRAGQKVRIVGGFRESDWIKIYEEGSITG